MKKIYSAAISPFTADNRPDTASLERVLERNIQHGLDGVFILGTMGEQAQIDAAEREEFIRCASDVMKGRGELLVGVIAQGLLETLKNIERASKYEFNSYVIMLPGRRTSQIPYIDYVREVCGVADRPVYFYHAPVNNGVELTTDDLKQVLEVPGCHGIKNSAGNMALRKELLALKRQFDFVLLEGHEWAVDEALTLGCDGALCGIGSLASKPLVQIARAIDAGNLTEAHNLQIELLNVFDGVYGRKRQTSWLGEKFALYKLGLLSSPYCRVQPESWLTSERQNEIISCLKKYKSFLD